MDKMIPINTSENPSGEDSIMSDVRTDEQDLATSERILNYAWNAHSLQVDNFHKLDSKAATLSGFLSVVLALIIRLYGASPIDLPKLKESQCGLIYAQYICAGILLVSLTLAIWFCLKALQTRESAVPAKVSAVIKEIRSEKGTTKKESQILKLMVKSLAFAEDNKHKINAEKVFFLKKAFRLSFISLSSGVAAYIFQITSIFLKSQG